MLSKGNYELVRCLVLSDLPKTKLTKVAVKLSVSASHIADLPNFSDARAFAQPLRQNPTTCSC